MVAILLTLAACHHEDTDGIVCTLEARPGLQVTVVDSVSSAPITSALTITATDGAYADTAKFITGGSAGLAYERAGIYTVEVTAASYLVWRQSQVSVTKGICHVNTVSLSAKLRKS
jgi:hypothetical protein